MKNFNFLQPQISQPKLHQIKHVGGVSESSQWADFKTAIGCQIWSRFHIEKGQKPLLQSKGGALYFHNNVLWFRFGLVNLQLVAFDSHFHSI